MDFAEQLRQYLSPPLLPFCYTGGSLLPFWSSIAVIMQLTMRSAWILTLSQTFLLGLHVRLHVLLSIPLYLVLLTLPSS